MSNKIVILGYTIENINYNAPADKAPQDKKAANMSITLNLGYASQPQNKDIHKVSVSAAASIQEIPEYNLSAAISGIFKTTDVSDPKELSSLISTSAAPMLVSVLREMLFNISSRSSYPPVFIPLVDTPIEIQK